MITVVGVFKTSSLLFDEINGYKAIPNQTFSTFILHPKNKDHKKLKLELMYESKEEILTLIYEKFDNLAAASKLTEFYKLNIK